MGHFNTPKNFVPGGISRFVCNWGALTGDPWVVDTVLGVKIPFQEVPVQAREPYPYRLSAEEQMIMAGEVSKLEQKGVIERVLPEQGHFISNVFLRPKPNLDLTELNKFVPYEHFKMTSLQTAIDMLRQDCWMGSVDLKDAYYSVGVHTEYRKFLRFYWNNQLYQFVAMPNGLACAPRIFTKLLTPIFSVLREEGVECFPYIDDSFVVADSKEECQTGIQKLCRKLDTLGLVVHEEKSVLEPTRDLVFLGFHLNSEIMLITPTQDKKDKFVRAATKVLGTQEVSIREMAGLIGLMVAYSVGVQYGAAHYKQAEREKSQALERCKGNFDGRMTVSEKVRQDIHWWLHNIPVAQKQVRDSAPEIEICTDASLEGWGAHRGETTAGGRWREEELGLHINILELKAILFGLKSLCPEENSHIRVLTDNRVIPCQFNQALPHFVLDFL